VTLVWSFLGGRPRSSAAADLSIGGLGARAYWMSRKRCFFQYGLTVQFLWQWPVQVGDVRETVAAAQGAGSHPAGPACAAGGGFHPHLPPAFLAGSGFPPTKRSEPRTVPTDHGVGLDDRQRVANIGEEPIEGQRISSDRCRRSEASLGAIRRKTLICWRSTRFSALKRRSRPEPPDQRPPDQPAKVQRPPDQPAKVPHRTVALLILPSLASRTSFATGTAAGVDGLELARAFRHGTPRDG